MDVGRERNGKYQTENNFSKATLTRINTFTSEFDSFIINGIAISIFQIFNIFFYNASSKLEILKLKWNAWKNGIYLFFHSK